MELSLLRLKSSMIAYKDVLSVISNNISNADTPYYKKDDAVTKSFYNMLSEEMKIRYSIKNSDGSIGDMEYTPGVYINDVFTIYNQGVLDETNDNNDIALDGEGFFSIEDNKEEFYTRGGSLEVDEEGYLTLNSYRVLGENGTVKIDNDEFTIDNSGFLSVDGIVADKLKLTNFSDMICLVKKDDGIYKNLLKDNEIEASCNVMQGFKEASNVDTTQEYLDIMKINSGFQAAQKAVSMLDEIYGLAANNIAKI